MYDNIKSVVYYVEKKKKNSTLFVVSRDIQEFIFKIILHLRDPTGSKEIKKPRTSELKEMFKIK